MCGLQSSTINLLFSYSIIIESNILLMNYSWCFWCYECNSILKIFTSILHAIIYFNIQPETDKKL